MRVHRRTMLWSVVTVVLMTLSVGVPSATSSPASTSNQGAVRSSVTGGLAGHDGVVSNVPASWTPQVLNGKVLGIAETGDTAVVGGSFTQASQTWGGTVRNQSRLLALDADDGQLNQAFDPTIPGGQVNAVIPGPTPGTVYVGGTFPGVNGQSGRVFLLDASTGELVDSFTPPAMNGQVRDLVLSGGRLYVAGLFSNVGGSRHRGVVALDASSGATTNFLQVQLTENHNWREGSNGARAGVGASKIAIDPAGTTLAVIGNFRKADGLERDQMALIDLTGPQAQVRPDWRTRRYEPACYSWAFDTYMRDLAASPDGDYFVVSTTGGGNSGTLCDSAARWDVDAHGDDVQPTWVDESGGDSLLGVTTSGTAVYAGGHQRWANNHNGSDNAKPGSVPRPGVTGYDAVSGIPLAWNPGRHPRGVGAEEFTVTDSGLWMGSDGLWVGKFDYRRARLAFFPRQGGYKLGDGDTGGLPSNAYFVGSGQGAGRDSAPSGLGRVWFTGDAVQTAVEEAPDGGIDWGSVRGAEMIDGELFYTTSDAVFHRRSFDGEQFGPDETIDPYRDPYWKDFPTGSGSTTYGGVQPSFYGQISSIRGLAYLDHEMYYTRAGSTSLYARGFLPDSGILRETTRTVAGFNEPNVGELFFDDSGDYLYFTNTSTGELSRIGWDGDGPQGTATVVSGPGVDGMDWRTTALFLADGPPPTGANKSPVAKLDSECDGLGCAFDGTGSEDPDGSIASYEWDFGDGGTSRGASVEHTYEVAGDYTVTLTVTDDKGATDTTTRDVTVAKDNQPPHAAMDISCTALECAYDGTGSEDPDGSIASYEWDLGDGSTATGPGVEHTYDAAGEYTVTLTVTDDQGAEAHATSQLQVEQDTASGQPELVGVSAGQAHSSTIKVSIPDGVQEGDTIMAFLTAGNDEAVAGPSGAGSWTLEDETFLSPMAVRLYSHVADGSEAGKTLTVSSDHLVKWDLTVVAYRGTGDDPVEVLATKTVRNTASHTSPTVHVNGADRMGLTYWSDRGGTTTEWTAPDGPSVLSTQIGSGGGRVSSLLVAEPAPAGTYGGLTADTNAPTSRAASMTVVIAP